MALSNRVVRLLQGGETATVEYKSKIVGELSEVFVQFANAKGGVCLIGVVDDKDEEGKHVGKVTGVQISDENKLKINSYAQNTIDKIEITIDTEQDENGESIYVVEVFEGRNKPYCTSGGKYLTRGDGQRRIITPTMMRDFFGGDVRLELYWSDESGNPSTTLYVPPLPSAAPSKAMKELEQALVTEAEIAMVRRHHAEVINRLAEDKVKWQLPNRLNTDLIDRLVYHNENVQSIITEIKNDKNLWWRYLIDDVLKKPCLWVDNKGTEPAIKPMIHLFPTYGISFVNSDFIRSNRWKPSNHRSEIIQEILSKAWTINEEERQRKSPLTIADVIGTAYASQISSLFGRHNPYLPDVQRGFGFPMRPDIHSLIKPHIPQKFAKWIDGERIVIEHQESIKHQAPPISPHGENVFLFSTLEEGEEAELEYICYADNLRTPSTGKLWVKCRHQQSQ